MESVCDDGRTDCLGCVVCFAVRHRLPGETMEISSFLDNSAGFISPVSVSFVSI